MDVLGNGDFHTVGIGDCHATRGVWASGSDGDFAGFHFVKSTGREEVEDWEDVVHHGAGFPTLRGVPRLDGRKNFARGGRGTLGEYGAVGHLNREASRDAPWAKSERDAGMQQDVGRCVVPRNIVLSAVELEFTAHEGDLFDERRDGGFAQERGGDVGVWTDAHDGNVASVFFDGFDDEANGVGKRFRVRRFAEGVVHGF